MPWIEAPREDGWGPEFEGLKEQVMDPTHDRVDWIMRKHALDADSLAAHNSLYRQAMKGTRSLRKVEREMMALVVSQVNDCHY